MQLSLSDDESTVLYLNDIAASKPLSRQREVALAARIKEGDIKARDELVWANLRFVIDVATKYQHRGLALLELISAGNLGLITAAERFDGTKGFKFISYAVWWIKQSILQTLAEQTRTVRLPQNKVALLRKIARYRFSWVGSVRLSPTSRGLRRSWICRPQRFWRPCGVRVRCSRWTTPLKKTTITVCLLVWLTPARKPLTPRSRALRLGTK